jgi:hypothetical protein
MSRHCLSRAISHWKFATAAVVALLAVAVIIPMVQRAVLLHDAYVVSLSKDRQARGHATLFTVRRERTAMATQSRRQLGVSGDYDSIDPSHPSSPATEPMEGPSYPHPRSAESHPTYHTVCVRLCDGYYFPMSFSVPHKYLARDAQRCQNQCGSEARLFVHRDANADIADMYDLEGRPYSKLESAFLYRTAYFPNCKCQAHPWEKEATERHRMYALAAAASNGDKAAAAELYALQGTLSQAKDKDAQPEPSFRPPATSRAPRAKPAVTSSERSSVPAAASWREKAFQSPN